MYFLNRNVIIPNNEKEKLTITDMFPKIAKIFKMYEFYNQRIYVQYVYLLILSLNFYTKLIDE